MLDEVEDLLWELKTEELTNYLRIAKIKTSKDVKMAKIALLLEAYKKEDFCAQVYENMTTFEKKYIETMTQNNFHPLSNELDEVYVKYNGENDKSNSWRYSNKYYDDKSKINLFCIKQVYPEYIKKQLKKIIPVLKEEYIPVKDIPNEEYITIEREDHVDDFSKVIKYLTSKDLKVTAKKEILTKAALTKIMKEIDIEDMYAVEKADIKRDRRYFYLVWNF